MTYNDRFAYWESAHTSSRVKALSMYDAIKKGGIDQIATMQSARKNKKERYQITKVFPKLFRYEIEDIDLFYKEKDGDWYSLPASKFCRRCGRVLTDPLSISRGIGPKCYEKEEGKAREIAEEPIFTTIDHYIA